MPVDPADLVIRPCLGATEYPALVEIWRSAVRATHDFLAEAGFERTGRSDIDGDGMPYPIAHLTLGPTQ